MRCTDHLPLEWPDIQKHYVEVYNARAEVDLAQANLRKADAGAKAAHDRWVRQTNWRRSVGLLEPEGSSQRLY